MHATHVVRVTHAGVYRNATERRLPAPPLIYAHTNTHTQTFVYLFVSYFCRRADNEHAKELMHDDSDDDVSGVATVHVPKRL